MQKVYIILPQSALAARWFRLSVLLLAGHLQMPDCVQIQFVIVGSDDTPADVRDHMAIVASHYRQVHCEMRVLNHMLCQSDLLTPLFLMVRAQPLFGHEFFQTLWSKAAPVSALLPLLAAFHQHLKPDFTAGDRIVVAAPDSDAALLYSVTAAFPKHTDAVTAICEIDSEHVVHAQLSPDVVSALRHVAQTGCQLIFTGRRTDKYKTTFTHIQTAVAIWRTTCARAADWAGLFFESFDLIGLGACPACLASARANSCRCGSQS